MADVVIFDSGVANLASIASGLDRAITDAVARGAPLLGVCLGMQMLCDASEEAPGVAGLGLITGTCRRLSGKVRVPHLGWNAVTAEPGARLGSSAGSGGNRPDPVSQIPPQGPACCRAWCPASTCGTAAW